IDTVATRDILVISAAGNDGIDLDTLFQYPACYPADNVITVGATQEDPNFERGVNIADFSNFSPTFVDILAPGTDIVSAYPSWGVPSDAVKSGTSMATPMVTAAAAMLACCFRSQSGVDTFSYQEVKAELLAEALSSDLQDFATNGWLLAYPEDCRRYLVSTEGIPFSQAGFDVFPNPGTGTLSLRARSYASKATIRLLSPEGRVLFSVKQPAWQPAEVQSITLPELPSGMYYLQIRGQDYQWTEKLIRY
ncbi:MAG: S8 family peptidase, partial [Bacteroidota bacterium]